MKNYPLLSLNNQKQWMSWRKTHLTNINYDIHSLWNYANYFLPDYCEYQLDIEGEGTDQYIDATQLPYNGYFKNEDTSLKIYLNNTFSNIILQPGFILLSKARNENGTEDIVNNITNYFVQPVSYGSYYAITYQDGQLVAIYEQYAEEKYGKNYMFSLFTYSPRFILTQQQGRNQYMWTVAAKLENSRICTQSGMLWTDIDNLKPMVFHFVGESDSPVTYGEEIVVDTYNYNSIRLEDFNIAEYNEVMLEKGESSIWPEDITMRLI